MRFSLKKQTLTLAMIIFTAISAFADPGDPPCDDLEGGPDSCPVPLDTWVIVLVVVGLIFASYRLYRKQEALSL